MMRLWIAALCFLTGVAATVQYNRTMTFINGCSGDIWVQGSRSTKGYAEPLASGFQMKQGASPVVMKLGHDWGARLWGSTGCSFYPNGTYIKGTCKTCDSGFQCTLVEIGVSSTGLDFWDISLVDGYSMGISVFTDVPYDIHNGRFDCGNSTCDQFNISKCPPEMTVLNADGSFHFCQKSCTSIRDPVRRAKYPIFTQLWNATDPYQGFPQRDNICCNCGTAYDGSSLGYSGCSDTRSHYCCRPNPSSPHGGICYYNQWPASSNGLSYYNVFKSQCKTAYAHDNDDGASTFTCSKSANFTVVFCALPPAYVQPPPLGCPNPLTHSCNVTANADLSGTSLDSAPLPTTDACCAWCLNVTTCAGWAWTGGHCYLKSSVSSIKYKNNSYSGTKTAAGFSCPTAQKTAAPCYCGAGYAGTLTGNGASFTETFSNVRQRLVSRILGSEDPQSLSQDST